MNISKKSQYGLRAMVCLGKGYEDRSVFSLRSISLKEGIPFDFLEKILSQLKDAGLIKGKKGVNGGYALSKNPQKITVKDIVSALENTVVVDCCLCGRSRKCLAKSAWKRIEDSLDKTLKSITLKELVK